MRTLSDADLLNIWEEGQGRSWAEKVLLFLTAASPGVPAESLVGLSIGQRDARLLSLRERTFGPHLDCLTACPRCGEQLELSLDVTDIRADNDTPAWSEVDENGETVIPAGNGNDMLSLDMEDYDVVFRLPNTADVVAILGDNTDIAAAGQRLLERCASTIHFKGREISVDALPAEVVDKIVEKMEQADPQADVRLDITCPACSHGWQATFDIVSFFWTELDTWAQRVLYQVDALARIYGWREADILAMSAWRRQRYMEIMSE